MKKISGKQLALAWVVALFICIIASLVLNQTLGRVACSIVWVGWFGLALWWGVGAVGLLDEPIQSIRTSQVSKPPTYQMATGPSAPMASEKQMSEWEASESARRRMEAPSAPTETTGFGEFFEPDNEKNN